jgi:hypothetical protein
MKRVFLGGTTTQTTWRKELIARLIQRGVDPDQIINPHLPHGVPYTPEHMVAERTYKADQNTIVLIYLCPAVIDTSSLDAVAALDKRERLGPISMFEVGKFAYSQPHRTAVVLDYQLFQEGGRAREVLIGLARELYEDFNGYPPYFSSPDRCEDWLVEMLTT